MISIEGWPGQAGRGQLILLSPDLLSSECRLTSAAASPRAGSPDCSVGSWEGSWDRTQAFDVTPSGMGGIDMGSE